MDERKLLLLVKNHPELYNPNHKDYRILTARKKAWQSIAREMNEDENYCKKRWKNIRAVVIRDYIDPKKQHSYYLKDYLNFYLPFMKSAKLTKTPAKINKAEDQSNSEECELSNAIESISEELPPITNKGPKSSLKIRKPYGSSARGKSPASFLSRAENDLNTRSNFDHKDYANQSESVTCPSLKISSDKAFLMAIYDDYKALDARRKRIFKGRAMNLLNELHDGILPKDGEFATIQCGDNVNWKISVNSENV